MYQNKLNSKGVWVSTFALLGIILKNKYEIDMSEYDLFVETLLVLLIQLGILNNPARKDVF